MKNRNDLCRPSVDSNVFRSSVYRPHHTSRYDAEEWEVAVSLPGAKKEDIRATVENEVLELVAGRPLAAPDTSRPLDGSESEKNWHLRLDVGPEVDENRISGTLEDGIVTLLLPLREEVKLRIIKIH